MDLLPLRLNHYFIIFYNESYWGELNSIEMTEFEEPKSPRMNTYGIPHGDFILLLNKICRLSTYFGSEFPFGSEFTFVSEFCLIYGRTSPFCLTSEEIKQWCQKGRRNIGKWGGEMSQGDHLIFTSNNNSFQNYWAK